MTWDAGTDVKGLEALASGLAGDHRQVHELAKRLGRAEEPAQIAEVVEELHRLLGPHFGDEERLHGFYQSLGERRPEYAVALAALREEHAQILAALEVLGGQATDQVTSPHVLAEEAVRLSALLFDHERRENELANAAEG
jgi:hypothetical protein